MPVEFELKSVHETPPDDFRYTVKQTGWTAKSYDFTQFFDSLRSHFLANNIPMSPTWKEEIVDEMCKANMPKWANYCKRIGKVKRKGNPSFGAVMTFLNVVKQWIKETAQGEPPFVTQEEAERRAAICVTCPMNTKSITYSCGGCMSQFLKMLFSVIGKKTTSVDNSLGGCGICSCALKVAVHVPLSPQQQPLSDYQKQQFREDVPWCWKRENL